jgi:KaiC/GvpD/RAD55 family RecA-like ATPase
MENIVTSKGKKEELYDQLISKIIESNYIEPTVKDVIIDEFTPTMANYALKHILKTVYDGQKITKKFMMETYQFAPVKTEKEQHEIVIQLRELYKGERLNFYLKQYSEDLQKAVPNAFDRYCSRITKLNVNMQPLKILSTHDRNAMMEVLDDITNDTYSMTSGMQGFDALQWEKGQLVGILGSTGDGKSIILQKLTAEFLKKGMKVDHYTVELTDKLFSQRVIAALGWFAYNELKNLTYTQKAMILDKLEKLHPMNIYSLKYGTININKIEKVLQQSQADVVFIDYCQLLQEEFNAATGCTVSQRLHELAVRYNCLIIMGLQTNNDGRNVEEPPELGHIKRVKELADDCDIVIALRGTKLATGQHEMMFKIVTRKHRNGVNLEAIYKANLNAGNWRMKRLIVNNVSLLDEADPEITRSDKKLSSEKFVKEIAKNGFMDSNITPAEKVDDSDDTVITTVDEDEEVDF